MAVLEFESAGLAKPWTQVEVGGVKGVGEAKTVVLAVVSYLCPLWGARKARPVIMEL